MERERQATFEDFLEPDRAPEPVAEVAVSLPLPTPLTYAIPDALLGRAVPGARVRVPVGSRQVAGFIIRVSVLPRSEGPLRNLLAVEDEVPCLTETTLALGLWVARHYGAPPGEALAAVVPAAVRHGRQHREESLVAIADLARAEATLVEHAEQASWEGRRRVLRLLIEAERAKEPPYRQTELKRVLEISDSPIHTLRKAGILRVTRAARAPDPFENLRPQRVDPPQLLPAQRDALTRLLPKLETGRTHIALLHGITGSGKTEVYLRLLARALELGKSAILLVPEIALTPQTVERILGRVPEVCVLHSNLSDGDRARQWARLRSGAVRVAVGPRSALFAPLSQLGLIVIDEEHETTFKQQQTPRYHARDAAIERARLEGALLVLGSATPSLEMEALARAGTVERISLPSRVHGRPLPEIAVIDMRHQKPIGPGGLFAPALVAAMDRTLVQKEQVLLFMNRRGFSTTVLCRACGWKAECRRCAIQLTHYRKTARLLCHYCGSESTPPKLCPECQHPDLRYGGFGTERIEEAVRALFPGKNVVRMDAETLRRRGAPERIFLALKSGEIDVLVGTQVLAKGFDIPGITLVGVVSADTALLIPDFRSSERTFQLLCQVAGRAGRGDRPGRVLIQTYCPDHWSIQAASKHDHPGFADMELKHRQLAGYPPYGHLLRVVLHGEDEARVIAEAKTYADTAASYPKIRSGEIEMLGPAVCPIAVLKDEHRHHLLFRAKDATAITDLLGHLPRRAGGSVRCLIDRDPVALL